LNRVSAQAWQISTSGTNKMTTSSIIFSVRSLEAALNAVKLKLGSIFDGNRFGNNPMTP